MQSGDDARGAIAPVEAGHREPLCPKCVGEIDDVLRERRLLGHARRRRIAEMRRTVAAKVRDEHTVTGRGERRNAAVEGAHVIGEAVEQNDRAAVGRAVLLVADVQRRRLHGAHARAGGGLRQRACHCAGSGGRKPCGHRGFENVASSR